VQELLASLPSQDFNDFNASGVAEYAGLPVADLVDQWRTLNADSRRRMRERGDGVVDTSVGEYPSMFQSYYFAVEYAAHGDDLGITTTYDGRDAWRAAFARFALTEQDRPVTLEARVGSTLVGLDGSTHDVNDHDLAEAAAARLPATHPIPEHVRAELRCCA
jgi:hypothetical protein